VQPGLHLASIKLGSFSADFQQLRLKQEVQQRQVNSISAVLALLLTDDEQRQLLKLRHKETAQDRGSEELRVRLRKLRGMRLLDMKKDLVGNNKFVANIKDNTAVDLFDFVFLTELGNRISEELERIESDKRVAGQRNS
jgi:hypothetical protein